PAAGALEGALAAAGALPPREMREIVTGKFSPLSCFDSASAFRSSANAPTWTQYPPCPASTGALFFAALGAFGVSAFAAGAGLAGGAAGAGTAGGGAVPTGRSAGLGAAGACAVAGASGLAGGDAGASVLAGGAGADGAGVTAGAGAAGGAGAGGVG